MNRRVFLKSAGVLSLSALTGSCQLSLAAKEQKKPNILFIFSDDHAVQAISAYGSRINNTPNIDRIAREGIILDRCFCCNSICAPSRAAILTGKHSHMNGVRVNRNVLDSSQQTFPKLMQKAGYQTAIIGKWHLKNNPTGFDHWNILIDQGNYYNPDFVSAEGKKRYQGYATDLITDMTIDWLENKRDKAKPFVMMCQHKAPHRTWAPNIKYLNMYDNVTIPMPDNFYDDYKNRNSALKNNEMTIANHMMMDYDLKVSGSKTKDILGRAFKNPELPRMTPEQRKAWDAAYELENEEFNKANLQGKELTEWKYQRYIKDYLRCIASVDESIGRLLDFLDSQNLAENTLVIYSSDQGFYLGEHGWYDKRWMYEESFRMPFTARWPAKIKAGTRSSLLVQNIDFAPTFLEAAGIAIPQDIQGRSLLPLFNEPETKKWRKSLYYHYYEKGQHNVPRHYGVRTGRYKLIHFYDIDEWDMFDLEKDPNEMKSIYNDPAYSNVRKMLETELKDLREKYQVSN